MEMAGNYFVERNRIFRVR